MLLVGAIYWGATKPTEIINVGTEQIDELEKQNAILRKFLTDSIDTQKTFYEERLRLSDSINKAKRINNYNLRIQHEMELEKYTGITSDSAYAGWFQLSRTAGFD